MPLRRGAPVTHRPSGVTDSVDATNAPSGSMQTLTNLVPDPSTRGAWVPRPAAVMQTDFAGFTNPGMVTAYLVVGDTGYGLVTTDRFPGFDEPFAINLVTNTFLTLNGVTAANVPATQPATGPWTPPIVAQVAQRILVTDVGFPGGATKFGWFDVSSFSDNTHTGNTNTSTSITNLSANVLQAGWQVGMRISSSAADIPAGTTIVSIAANGLSLVLSAAATASTPGVTLTVTGGTPVNPLWAAGDTNLNNLPSVPVGVAQMRGRAYFACGVNGIPWTDSLNPCQRTNASQALTTSDGLAVTAIGPLGLKTLLGGIVQSLIAFEGVSKIQQITGDQTTNDLFMNALPVSTGTNSPLSITPTTLGLAFVSPDGLRFIDFAAVVSDPVGASGQGVTVPFTFCSQPTRICAAANASVLRISTLNGKLVPATNQEWWYDLARKTWSGPHSFPASQIELWRNTFSMAAIGVAGKLWSSDVAPNINSTYLENGAQLIWTYQTSYMPDTGMVAENALVDMTLAVAATPGTVITVRAFDMSDTFLDTTTVPPAGFQTLWGGFNWGQALWGGAAANFQQYGVDWNFPLVFKQLSIEATGISSYSVRISDLYMKYQILGYKVQGIAA